MKANIAEDMKQTNTASIASLTLIFSAICAATASQEASALSFLNSASSDSSSLNASFSWDGTLTNPAGTSDFFFPGGPSDVFYRSIGTSGSWAFGSAVNSYRSYPFAPSSRAVSIKVQYVKFSPSDPRFVDPGVFSAGNSNIFYTPAAYTNTTGFYFDPFNPSRPSIPASDLNQITVTSNGREEFLTSTLKYDPNPNGLGGIFSITSEYNSVSNKQDVPEPLTIFGSGLAIAFGTFLKRRPKSAGS
jgi:hypothetical protein